MPATVEFDGNEPKTRRTRPVFHFIVATLAWLSATPAIADMTVMTDNTLFCPSWAEAHERSLASLNNGRKSPMLDRPKGRPAREGHAF
jgi:hypothetical protein